MKYSLCTVYMGCSLAAIACFSCGLYNIHYTATENYDDSNPIETIKTFDRYINQWYDQQQKMALSLLMILSGFLTLSYIVLICNLCRYFKDQMAQEIKRLTLLFATFTLSYILRSLYMLGINQQTLFYAKIIPHMATRWAIILSLPLFWDLASILSILVLHFKSFRQQTKNFPKAGHMNENAGLPTVENLTLTDPSVVSEREDSFMR